MNYRSAIFYLLVLLIWLSITSTNYAQEIIQQQLPDSEQQPSPVPERPPENENPQAIDMQSDSQQDWVQLQLTYMEEQNWETAAEAGVKALESDPNNFLVISRQAYIRFMLQDYASAEVLYKKALEEESDNGEMLLGLGFTRIYQGEAEEGYELCHRARTVLQNDPRIDECLATRAPDSMDFHTSIFGTYLHYTNPWNLKNLMSLTLKTSLNWPTGLGLWIGANFSESVLNYNKHNFLQTNPVLGVFFKQEGLTLAGSATWLFSNDMTVKNTKVIWLDVGYDKSFLGGSVGVASSFYPTSNVFQIDPRLRIHVDEILHISTGPELIIRGGDDQGSNATSRKTAYLWSGHLGITFIPITFMSVLAKGFYGTRSFAVEGEGLSVWSNGDRFMAGYRIGTGVDMGKYISSTLTLIHEFGVEQSGMEHEFQIIGGMLGIYGHL